MAGEKRIGVVYTPSEWATWAIKRFQVVEAWQAGKRIADPTVGDGSFIKSLFEEARIRQIEVTAEMVANLFGFDLLKDGVESLVRHIKTNYGVSLSPFNFRQLDAIFDTFPTKFDVIIGNPPWANFANLPTNYKQAIKPKYAEYGLLAKTHSTLLGNSRVDIAALVVSRLMSDAIEVDGNLLMFLPSSLFDGIAHEPFRRFRTSNTQFYLNELFDFANEGIFGPSATHGTNFSFAKFSTRPSAEKVVPEYRLIKGDWESGTWRNLPAVPNQIEDRETAIVSVNRESKPRQGINTCGANGIFFGDLMTESLANEIVQFRNLSGEIFDVESALVFPLLMRANLLGEVKEPLRYCLVPHDTKTGKALSASEIQNFPLAHKYFNAQKTQLENRKGTLIQSAIKNGAFWSLLGVGPYSFASHKLIWLTAGQSDYEPQIVDGIDGKPWQANQSMQAFMPFNIHADAVQTMAELKAALRKIGLEVLGTPKSLSWAQPGRVSRLISLKD